MRREDGGFRGGPRILAFRGFHSKISTTSTDRDGISESGNGDTSAESKGFGRILSDKDAALPSFPRQERDL